MKDWLTIIGWVGGFAVLIFGMMYGVRMFSNAATPLTLHSPKPGVTCAAMVTEDGAALSCWKD